jgi:hypothetical protein
VPPGDNRATPARAPASVGVAGAGAPSAICLAAANKVVDANRGRHAGKRQCQAKPLHARLPLVRGSPFPLSWRAFRPGAGGMA